MTSKFDVYTSAMVQCLVFLAQKCTKGVFGPVYYWLQSADRAWCIRAPISSFELESALVHLPSRVLLNFNRLESAMNRGEDLWAIRLGTTEMDEADLAHDWVAAPHPHVTFREPVDEGDDDIDIRDDFSS